MHLSEIILVEGMTHHSYRRQRPLPLLRNHYQNFNLINLLYNTKSIRGLI